VPALTLIGIALSQVASMPELRRSQGFVTPHTIKSGETAASRCSPAALATGRMSNQSPIFVTGLIELILVERCSRNAKCINYVHSQPGQARPNRCRL
jgi:hypothetical protein